MEKPLAVFANFIKLAKKKEVIMDIDQFITKEKRVKRFESKEDLKDYVYQLIVKYFGFDKVIEDLTMGQETHQHLRMFMDIDAWIENAITYSIYEIIESDGYLYLIENDPLRKEEVGSE